MSVPAIFDLCEPRADVRAGTSSNSDFAADLSHVIRGTGGPVEYREPALFFANTYPTRGLKSLLSNVCIRLTGRSGAVAAIFRLDTSFGGGKTVPAAPETPIDLRRAVWEFIAAAPMLPFGGDRVGEATSAVVPWPHQVRAFHRMYDAWPPKLLIADEVGLGKTIVAGPLLRQAWLARKAERILIPAPKNVCNQWQIELREKFNLNWPIYDGQKLCWYPSPAKVGHHERVVSREDWHKEPIVIASSHLVRRVDRQKELLEAAAPWDLVILDEAHHARRRGAGSSSESGPNALLRLMRALRERTTGLVLLTATPMQVHPVEVSDHLLSVLGFPPEWTEAAFLRFFDAVLQESPSHEAFDDLARMFRGVESAYGEVAVAEVQRLGITSPLRAKRVLSALRDRASTPRRQLEIADRKAALRLMRLHTPVNRLISRELCAKVGDGLTG